MQNIQRYRNFYQQGVYRDYKNEFFDKNENDQELEETPVR
jgi:hypothetical protein